MMPAGAELAGYRSRGLDLIKGNDVKSRLLRGRGLFLWENMKASTIPHAMLMRHICVHLTSRNSSAAFVQDLYHSSLS